MIGINKCQPPKETNNMAPREWAHFIGEEQYSIESFIAEAEKYGISRNTNVQQLKGIQYGDTINLMQWDGTQAILFAQFVVRRVFIRDTEISAAVAEKLMEDGKAQPGGGGGDPVHRACGSYITGPGIVVDDEKMVQGFRVVSSDLVQAWI